MKETHKEVEEVKNYTKVRKRKKIVLLTILNLTLILCLAIVLSAYGKVFYKETKYAIASLFDENIKNSKKYYDGLPSQVASGDDILREPILDIPDPVDPNFSIIIPKIDVNERVVMNVDINNPDDVAKALGEGVGWANTTVAPGEYGNSLLFSHSTQNAWDILRYNSVFTLLRKLEINDMFSIVYKGRQMDFLVFETTIVPANDTSYLTAVAKGNIVTLQTCDPPGDDTNRKLVRARLVAREVK